MKLRVKDINLSTGGPLIAVISDETARKMDLYAADRIRIKHIRKDKSIIVTVDVSTKGIKPNEVGLFEESISHLDVKEATHVEISHVQRPKSIDFIKKKLKGYPLTKNEFRTIINDIMSNHLSDIEMTYFVAAAYTNSMTLQESDDFTDVIVEKSTKLNINKRTIVDKHSVGGIPGNRTTLVVVPIIAAAGLTIPKTSSRSITSPAGTADTMEVLAPVRLHKDKILKTLRHTNGCIIWESSLNPFSPDDELIKIRRPLNVDPEGLLLSSVLAKKKIVGATHVLIDIPYGKGAKFSKRKAVRLREKFIRLGRFLKMHIHVILTDGTQPIGNGIGPALEARDCISVLKGNGPNDLREKCIFMAYSILKMANIKNPRKKVIDILDSGLAFEKMLDIIKFQGGKKHINIPLAKNFYSVRAKNPGIVKEINNHIIARIAKIAGAPKDKYAGLYLRVHKKDRISRGGVLYTIYSNSRKKLDFAVEAAKFNPGIVIK